MHKKQCISDMNNVEYITVLERKKSLFKMAFFGERYFHICNEDCYDSYSEKPCAHRSSINIRHFGSLYETLLCVEKIVIESNYIAVEEGRYVPQIHPDEHFIARKVVLKDGLDRTILKGLIQDQKIRWIQPACDDPSIEKIKILMKKLNEESAVESGWDNYSTTDSLRTYSDTLDLELIDNYYIPIFADSINGPNLLISFHEN
jgi:YHS domain-containing protein